MHAKKPLRRSPGVPLKPEQVEAMAQLFDVLSDPTRLRILQRLHAGPAAVGEIVADLEMKQANVSKQLGVLFAAGVVARRRLGVRVEYRVGLPLVMQLCDLVCGGLADAARDRAAALGRRRRRVSRL